MNASISFLFVLPGLVGACLALWMAVVTAQQRPGTGWQFLVATGAAVSLWCVAQVCWVLSRDALAVIRIAQMQYGAIAIASIAWLLHALAQTGRARGLKIHWVGLMFAVPLLTTALALDYGASGANLLWSGLRLPPETPVPQLTHGPWFWVFIVHTDLLFLSGCVLLLRYFAQSTWYRVELLITAAFPLILLVINALFLTGNWLLPLDPAPLGFGIGFAMFGWAMQRGRLFELQPVGRSMAFESMSEGILIIDAAGHIVESNPAAGRLLGNGLALAQGRMLRQVLPLDVRQIGRGQPLELDLPREDGCTRRVQIGATEITSQGGRFAGSVLILRDVSLERAAQRHLLAAHGNLRKLNAELKRLARSDPLTGLANRRTLFERLGEEWARARRYQSPLALLMIDLDLFKRVNDTQGHVAGDAVLVAAARALVSMKRPTDLVARYGGEEFALLLPQTDEDGARGAADRAWESLRSIEHRNAARIPFRVTASIGLATIREPDAAPLDLVARADAALYAAKRDGRDRIGVALLQGFEIYVPASGQVTVLREFA